MNSQQPNIKDTLIQLLANLANPQEIDQYMKRFVNAGQTHFAVIKVGGAVLNHDINNLCSSLAFLVQIGLFPIVVHGAGPQLSKNLNAAGLDSQFIEGQRITTAPILKIAKKTFIQQNLKLSNQLQTMGIKTASITTGVFYGQLESNQALGYVGTVDSIDLSPIKSAIANGAIPLLSSLAETENGQTLNINADIATNQLAIALRPYKIIFLTETGGLLDQQGKIISTINLTTDLDKLLQQTWLQGGMKLKITQIAQILEKLPSTASVSITKPLHLAKELFTHKGSGTLIRLGEAIIGHDHIASIQQTRLKQLLESSFNKTLNHDYFEQIQLHQAWITNCYRAAALITLPNKIPFLDKFVVAKDAKGEGLGKTVWAKVRQNHPQLFWRSQPDNPINTFYFKQADGCYKTHQWHIFWYGITDLNRIELCIEYALQKPVTLKTAQVPSNG